MVRVTSFAVKEKKDGTTFTTLELTGSLELVQSKNGNGFYATVRKTSIPCTFEADVAAMMVGQQLDGEIVRVASPTYQYVNKRTGEMLQLSHSFAYRPKGSIELIGQTQVEDGESSIVETSAEEASLV